MTAPPVLSCRGLHIAYARHEVVSDVSFDVHPGRVTAIMGPSGCGKSTLLKALNRSLELNSAGKITRGNVLYQGQDIHDPGLDPRRVRMSIGIIQQRPVPFPLSIEQNVVFAPRFFERIGKREQRERTERHLRMVGLWDEVKDRLHEPADSLSGGQQQRLCMARTLANQASVLLMDEPCSALDPVSSERIEQLIAELKTTVTIVVVTHNVGQARRVSDDCVFLYQGKLVEAGGTSDIFDNPQTDLARGYVRGTFG